MRSEPQDTDAAVFGYSPTLRLTMVGCLLVFLIFLGMSVGLPQLRPKAVGISWLGIAVFGSFAALTLTVLRKMWDKVSVDAESIRYIPRKGDDTVIAWADIAGVVANDVGQRIVLTDASGQKTIRLEYQLHDFARLRAIVMGHTAAIVRGRAIAMTVFHRSWINKGIFLSFAVILGICGWPAYRADHPVKMLFFLGLAASPLALVVSDPSRVIITPTTVKIAYPFHTRTIAFAEISSVELADIGRKGNVWATVTLTLRGGKSVRLMLFREGSLALHEALRSAWTRAGGAGRG